MRSLTLTLLCFACACSSTSTGSNPASGGAGGAGASGGTSGSGGASGSAGAAGSAGAGGVGITAYEQAVSASKPGAWWRFEEVSGATVTDEGGSFVGTFSGAVNAALLNEPGALGTSRALKLTDDDVVVDFGDNFDFDGASLFTIEVLINPSNFDLPRHNLLTKFDQVTSTGWATYVAPAADPVPGLRATLFDQGAKKEQSGLLVSSNTWSYIAFTYDATFLCTYLGLSGGTSLERTCTISSVPVSIPNSPAGMKLGNGFQGRVDELAIYTRRLAKAELQKHYDAALGEGL